MFGLSLFFSFPQSLGHQLLSCSQCEADENVGHSLCSSHTHTHTHTHTHAHRPSGSRIPGNGTEWEVTHSPDSRPVLLNVPLHKHTHSLAVWGGWQRHSHLLNQQWFLCACRYMIPLPCGKINLSTCVFLPIITRIFLIKHRKCVCIVAYYYTI